MSSIANLSSAPAALPPISAHAHGHKRGLHIESSEDSSSDTAAQIPPGAAQNLFGGLLQSLEQVIGLQPTTTAAAATTGATTPAAATTTAGASSGAAAAAGTTASTSASSTSTLLQNYLNNLSQTLQGNGSQSAKNAGSNLSVNA
jgi:hypothetical protein